jgi:hypothetical protein
MQCSNGGSCQYGLGSTWCQCASGWAGSACNQSEFHYCSEGSMGLTLLVFISLCNCTDIILIRISSALLLRSNFVVFSLKESEESFIFAFCV